MGFMSRLAAWANGGPSLPKESAKIDGYDGGSYGRKQLSSFTPLGSSPDAAHLPQARTIRARSRELARNSALALGAINTTVTSVVGSGLELHSRVDADYLGLTQEQANAWQTEAERIFRGWAESESDLSRACTFYGLQDLAFRSVLEGGDCFAVLTSSPRKDALIDVRVQLIEAELCSNPDGVKDSPTMVAGVEKDPTTNAPIAYHFSNHYPGFNHAELKKKWTRVQAFGSKSGRRNVLHLMRVLRPGQTRGVSFLAPVIEPLKQLKDYTEAEITAAVISGMYAIFIKTPTGDGFEPLTGKPREDDTLELTPGLIASLAEGEEPMAFNPGRPNTAFEAFVQAIIRQIGVALELPYEVMIKQFVSSYSAARGAVGEAWRFFRARREWLNASFNQPCFEAVIDEAVLKGLLQAPGYFDDIRIRRAYLGSEWTGDGQGQLNPVHEANAAKTRIELGISNRAIETSEIGGRDWRSVHAQLAREEAQRLADGISVAPSPTKPGVNQPPAPASPKEDEEEDPTEDPPEDEE